MKKWDLVKIGDCCKVISGSTPRRNKPEYWNGDILWATPKDLSKLDGQYLNETPDLITQEGYKSCSTTLLPKGAILFSSRAPIGLVAIAGKEMCTNQGFKSLIPEKSVDSNYLYWCMKFCAPKLAQQGSGTTFKEVSKTVVERFKIPLPPIAEQKRIAEILDKADAVRRKRQEAIRLTEELLRSTFLDMFGDPVTNPKGWDVVKLGEIAEFLGGGTPSRKQEDYFKGSIGWATSKDMGVDILEDTEEHITQEAIDNSSTQYVSRGNLLVVVKSKILIKRLPVARLEIDCCFNQDIKAILLHDLSTSRYIHRHMRIGQHSLLRLARGVNTEGLTLEHLKNYKVMIPERKKIYQFCEIDKKIEGKLKHLAGSLQESENLFNSLLQRAFRGEL